MQTPPAAARILVIRLGAVGDVVRTLPAVSALRAQYPDARLSWLVESLSADLLEAQPWIDEVLVFPREELSRALRRGRVSGLWRALRDTREQLRRARFDLVVDFHAILKSGVLSLLCGAPLRATLGPPLGREGAWHFANRVVSLPQAPMSRFDRNQGLVRGLGIQAPAADTPLVVSPGALAQIAERRMPGPAPVLLHPGSSPGTPYKRWSAERFGALARALTEDGFAVEVSFGSGEQPLATQVVRASAGTASLAPATRSLLELAALCAKSRLFVSGDTGPLHIASLVGTPVVQILGPTDPVQNAPWKATPSRSLREPVACSPCRRGCAEVSCLEGISVDRVRAAVLELSRGPLDRAAAQAS